MSGKKRDPTKPKLNASPRKKRKQEYANMNNLYEYLNKLRNTKSDETDEWSDLYTSRHYINSDVAVIRFCASSKLGSNCKLQKWCLEAQQNNILRA